RQPAARMPRTEVRPIPSRRSSSEWLTARSRAVGCRAPSVRPLSEAVRTGLQGPGDNRPDPISKDLPPAPREDRPLDRHREALRRRRLQATFRDMKLNPNYVNCQCVAELFLHWAVNNLGFARFGPTTPNHSWAKSTAILCRIR